MRKIAVGALSLAAPAVLAGCSPSNVTGITVTAQGVPVLRNCGAWFRDVQVSDGQSGRVVWSAGKPAGTSEFGVGDVQVGLLPDLDWVERVPVSFEPRPVVWRFAIQFRSWEPQTIEVSDHDLVTGQVYTPGRSGHISEKAFNDDVCGYGSALSLGVVSKVGLLLVLLFVVVHTYEARATRRRASRASTMSS